MYKRKHLTAKGAHTRLMVRKPDRIACVSKAPEAEGNRAGRAKEAVTLHFYIALLVLNSPERMVSLTLRSSFSKGYGLGDCTLRRGQHRQNVYSSRRQIPQGRALPDVFQPPTKPDQGCTTHSPAEAHKWVSSAVHKLPNNSWAPHCSNVERWLKRAFPD